MKKDIKDLKVLISNDKLIKRIKEVAQEINEFYGKNQKIHAICVLKGAVMFYCELVKYLKMPIEMEFISLSSYGNSTISSGVIKPTNLKLPNYENENVLIIEDIIDSGLTLDFLIKHIKENCNTKNIKLAVMFDKKCARKHDISPDFSAFEVDSKFIVGFGLDYCEMYRNLDYIGYFE